MPIETRKIKNKAFLVIVKNQTQAVSVRESYEELKELSESALIHVIGSAQTNLP